MKTVQAAMDEELLAKPDRDENVQRLGGAPAGRRRVSDTPHPVEITRQCRGGYGVQGGQGDDFAGREDEAAWMLDLPQGYLALSLVPSRRAPPGPRGHATEGVESLHK